MSWMVDPRLLCLSERGVVKACCPGGGLKRCCLDGGVKEVVSSAMK